MKERSLVQNLKNYKSLPLNWVVNHFDDVLTDCSGGNEKILNSEFLISGDYPIVDQGQELIAGYTNRVKYLVKKNPPYIVFGDHTRIFKYINFPFAMGADGVKVLKPLDESTHLPKYLYYFFLTLNIPNTGYNRHYKYLKDIQVPFPSLTTQQKIAAILDAADAYRQKTKALIEKYDQLAQSLFLEMFGDPATNPKGWEVVTIRDMVCEVKYGTSSKAGEKGAYPYLRMNNITYQGFMDLTDLKYIDISISEREKYLVRKGDVIFNRTNSKELVGKTGLITSNEEMVIAGYLIRIRVNEFANPYFLWAHLNSKWAKLILMNMCKNIVGMANINAQEMQSIKILKAPLTLQTQFADRIQWIEAQKQQARAALAKADELFNSLLQRAFKGELVE